MARTHNPKSAETSLQSDNKNNPTRFVVDIPLNEIDFDDTELCFRVRFDLSNLKEDIEKNGQQFPVILRKKPTGRYQIVSGFRRCNSLRELQNKFAKAIVRNDLNDDDAYYISFIENEKRKNLTGMDKACAIAKLAAKNKTPKEIQALYGIGERQFFRLKKAADFPDEIRESIFDGFIQITHGLVLIEAREIYGLKMNFDEWIDWVIETKASVSKLKQTLRERFGKKRESYIKKTDSGGFRLSSIRFEPLEVNQETAEKVRSEINEALNIVEQWLDNKKT